METFTDYFVLKVLSAASCLHCKYYNVSRQIMLVVLSDEQTLRLTVLMPFGADLAVWTV